MSRLFSRLESTGQVRSDSAPAPDQPESDMQPDAPAPAACPLRSGGATGSPDATARPPSMPGYSISAMLSTADPRPAEPVPANRPDWGIRLWLFSLFLLIALALLLLALPERMYPVALQRQSQPSVPPDAAPRSGSAPPALQAPQPARAPVAAAPAGRPVAPPDLADLPPAAARASAPVANAAPAQPPTAALPKVRTPVSAVPPAGAGPACSQAMLALNLCNTSPP